jgi:hypothetical protein
LGSVQITVDNEIKTSSDVFGDYRQGDTLFQKSGQNMLDDDFGESTWSTSSGIIGEPGRESYTQNTANLEPSSDGNDPFEHYLDAALADCVGFFQISEKLFVVQGWDVKGRMSTVWSDYSQDAPSY